MVRIKKVKSYYKIIITILLGLIFTLLIEKFNKEPNFTITPDIDGKEVYFEKHGFGDYYILENDSKREVFIKMDDFLCSITNVKTNNSGVKAIAVFTFDEDNNQMPVGSPEFFEFRTLNYILFVFDKKVKSKYVESYIEEIKWENDGKLKVILKDRDGQRIKYLKNPF